VVAGVAGATDTVKADLGGGLGRRQLRERELNREGPLVVVSPTSLTPIEHEEGRSSGWALLTDVNKP
jgi:hypothetical protein